MEVVNNYLKEAVEWVFQEEAFKGQIKNTLYKLPNTAIRNLSYSVVDESINIMIDYVFKPTSEEFDNFVDKHSDVSLNVLKSFYEKYCDALISGRVMMFHFIAYSSLGGYVVQLTDEFGETVIEPLINLVDVNIEVGYTIEVDYSNVFNVV